MVVLCGTLAGGLLGFFFGTDLGKTILEQIFWGGLIGALVGNGITFIVNNA